MNYEWDRNKDGKIDSSDLLAAFDTDGSGNIDKDEIQHFAEQLAQQLEYNSQILGQLHQAEQEKLALSREVQNKQESVKRLTDTVDQMRNDLSETKRKLNVAQEIADTLSKQLREARMDVNNVKREMDSTVRSHQDINSQVDNATRQRDDLQRALNECQQMLARANDSAAKRQSDLASQLEIQRHMNEAANKEAADLRAKVFPLESDNRKLLNHIQELTATLAETSQRCEQEAQARLTAEKRAKDLAVATEKMRERHLELQYSVRESEDAIKAHRAKVDEHVQFAEATEDKLRESEERVTVLTQALAHAKDEISNLHHELEHLSNELVTQARIRQQEQEKVAAKQAADRAEMDRILRDTKMHSEDFTREAENRASEANESRQKVEKKLVALQKECNDLHELAEKLQADNQTNVHAWEAQKSSLLQTIAQLQDKCDRAEDKMGEATKTQLMEKEHANQIVKGLKQDMAKRGEKFVETLSGIQLTVKKMRDDAVSERNKVRELVGYVALLKGKVDVLDNVTSPPLMSVRPELENVFRKLWEKSEAIKEQLEDSKDDLRRAQLSREEERSKSLMQEEQISRLELELASKDRTLVENEQRLQERVVAQKSKIDKLTVDNSALESKIQTLHQTLQETGALAKNLQMTNQQMHAAMDEINSRHTDNRQDVESKLGQLSTQLRRTTQEKDDLARALEELRSQSNKQQRDADAARTVAVQAQQQLEDLQRQTEASLGKQKLTMNAVGGATQRYQQQLKQNQDILQVELMNICLHLVCWC
jgi:chromosome segregation ATPase